MKLFLEAIGIRCWILLYELLVWEALEAPKRIRFIVIPFVCPQNLKVRPYCWKHWHCGWTLWLTIHLGCRMQKSQAGTPHAGQFSQCWRVLGKLLGRRAIESSQPWTLRETAALLTCRARCAHWFNSGTAVMQHPTAFWLDLRSVMQVGSHGWHCKPGQEPWLGRPWASSKTLTRVLLGAHVKLPATLIPMSMD